MTKDLILASGSGIRRTLFEKAGLSPRISPAHIDERAIQDSLLRDRQDHSRIAAALAEAKAIQVSKKNPDALVIGADQVLSLGADVLSKPLGQDDAIRQLQRLRGRSHRLISSVCVADQGTCVWSVTDAAVLWMRDLSDRFIERYVARNWDDIRHCVGCYQIENAGITLFTRVSGDYHVVLGLPVFPLLSYLQDRGFIEL
ncbi:MAG: Maf family nucleotide pyrophosphatase [Pseudomonadota bacterium]